MPIHDWTRLEAGDFHHFHQRWITDIAAALNGGLLPPEYMALAEQVTGRPIPDVVTLHARPSKNGDAGGAPLETTYQEAWAVFPAMLKELIDAPAEQPTTKAESSGE